MILSPEEKHILNGGEGSGAQKAMEILVALGKIFHAKEMVPVSSAQISGVSYYNIGDHGLDFLTDWAASGAKTKIPALMNPAGMDRTLWQQLGIPESFALKQLKVIEQLQIMGVQTTLTCTPYHVGFVPRFKQHLAWSESSAVSYANSVLGAYTNREGGPSALAAAITGCTPRFGFHLAENRIATHDVTVNLNFHTPSEYGLLGYLVGRQISDGIPYFEGLDLPEKSWQRTACLKALGAAMAASGAVALYHIFEQTPEARESGRKLISPQAKKIIISDLKPAYAALKQSSDKLDLVTLGCPHYSIEEITEITSLLHGKRLKVPLWITTSAGVRQQAEQLNLVEIIKKAGGMVIADTCMVVAPIQELGFKYIAVDSAKAACYLPSHHGAITYWGTTEQCIQAAIEGKWTC